MSKKYGKRSYARYPIFWGLKKVGNLPNPDPSDTSALTPLPKDEDIKIDVEFEAGRGEYKRQAQEWAGLIQNPKADLLVFVGRWSNQKGIDLIADVFPSVLEERAEVQLICIGPVIDLYGKFAALKLDKMMKLYPGRVFSKPEFTALPPYIFSGAEFALIPSRDEPFGLVAVEFGRKGALGIGARVGGLGQMPGWWYTVESTTTTHLLHQFKMAIQGALASKPETRAMMRARSAKQRFPVAQWVEDLEILQSTAITIHKRESTKSHARPVTPTGMGYSAPGDVAPPEAAYSRQNSHLNLAAYFGVHSRTPSLGKLTRLSYAHSRGNSHYNSRDPSPINDRGERTLSLGKRAGPGHAQNGPGRGRNLLRRRDSKGFSRPPSPDIGVGTPVEEETGDALVPVYDIVDEYLMTAEEAEAMQQRDLQMGQMDIPPLPPLNPDFLSPRHVAAETSGILSIPPSPNLSRNPSQRASPGVEDGLLTPTARFVPQETSFSNASMLSFSSIVGDKKDFKLQKVDPFFTDSTGEYFKAFEQRLQNLGGKNSESSLCIEEYLVKSEKKWFDRFREAKLGKMPGHSIANSRAHSPAASGLRRSRAPSPGGSSSNVYVDTEGSDGQSNECSISDQFLLGKDYVPPTGLRRWMQIRIGDWPLYSFFLAFGQIIAANSYQITLLTGTVGQAAEKLYIVATIYLITSLMWWICFRSFKSIYVLSLPFVFYGLAVSAYTLHSYIVGVWLIDMQFFFIGMAHFVPTVAGRGWVQNVATAMYAMASSSGSIFFALNFGDEGDKPPLALDQYVMLTTRRWCSCQSLGLPCLRDTGHATSLRRRSVVLGLNTDQRDRRWRHSS